MNTGPESLIRQKLYEVLVLPAVLLGFVLRVFRLDVQSLRGDEILSLVAIRGDLNSMISSNALLDHPPLYFLFLRSWVGLIGSEDFTTRFPSVLFGVLTIPIVYQLGKHLFDRSIGILAAVCFSVSPFLVSYGQEARSYSMAIFFATCSVNFLIRVLDRGGRTSWFWWSMTSLLAVMSDYTAIQVVAFAEGFLLFAVLVRRRLALQWIFSNTLIAVPFLPWIFLNRAVDNIYMWDGAAWGNDFGQILRSTLQTFTVGTTLEGWAVDVFAYLYLLIGVAGLLFGGLRRRNAAFVVSYMLIPIAVTWAVSLGILGFAPRHLLVATPAFFLFVAVGLGWLSSKSKFFLAISSALIIVPSSLSLNNYYFNPNFYREDFRSPTGYLDDQVRDSEVVVFSSPWSEELFLYYKKGEWSSVAVPQQNNDSVEQIESRLKELTQKYQKIWLVVFHPESMRGADYVERWLEKNSYALGPKGYHQSVVKCYLTRPPITSSVPPISFRQEADLEGKIKFLGYDLDASEVSTRSRLYLTLYWQALQNVERDYRIYANLTGGLQRQKWGEKDNRPIYDTFQTSRWVKGSTLIDEYAIDIAPGTPPGEYGLVTGVYDPATGTSLGVTGKGRDNILLGSVRLGKGKAPETLDVLRMHNYVGASFGSIVFLGAQLPGTGLSIPEIKAGDSVPLSLYWQAKAASTKNHDFSLMLMDDKGNVISSSAASPAGGHYPSADWSAREIVMDKRRFPIPPSAPEGIYKIVVGIDENAPVEVGEVKVKQRQRSFTIPEIQNVLLTPFDNNIVLLGYDIAAGSDSQDGDVFVIRPGNSISLTLHWKASDTPTGDYAVFNHFADQHGKIWGQKDTVPLSGEAQTSSWMTGEVIDDGLIIPVRQDTPKGRYELITGLYRQDTGQRALAGPGQDRIVIGRFEVR